MTVRTTIRHRVAAALLAAGLAAAAATAMTAVIGAPASAVPRDVDQRAALPVPTTATVTAAQLGTDSTIAVVTHGNFEKLGATGLARSLEVITPDGVRHPVYSVDVEESRRGWLLGDFVITDWRPELHTALLRVSLGADGDMLVSYDVTTGATREVVPPPRGSFFALDPDGSGVLMTTYATERRTGRVARLDWDGTRTWLPARAGDTGAITSIDGRTLVTNVGGQHQWWVTDLAAGTSAAIDTPGDCRPQRWLDADTVLATCSNRRSSQLRQVDLDGSSWRMGIRHTARTRASGPDVFNDDDVRTLRGRAWYESYGGCGGGFLTRQTASGKVRLVHVPGRDGALSLVGTRGKSLVLAHQADDCASTRTRAVLALFDPVSKVETELTRLARDEQWREVFLATEVRAWIW